MRLSFGISALFAATVSAAAQPVTPGFNFPDPGLVWAEGKWWAFGTRTIGSSINIQIATSSDFQTWSVLYSNGQQVDALPTLPPWVNQTTTVAPWAPDVVVLDDGSYLLYFAAQPINSLHEYPEVSHCIGAATSKTVQGPYTALSSSLVCPGDSDGAIDASGFKDWETKGDWTVPSSYSSRKRSRIQGRQSGNSFTDPAFSEGGKGGKRYIVYKTQSQGVDGDASTTSTPITLQEVDATDGVTLIGGPSTILTDDQPGDDGSTEAPVIIKSADASKYWLFFSKGATFGSTYTVSTAVADSVTGPYTRVSDVLVTGDDGLNSPGGADPFWDNEHLLFHALEGPVGEILQPSNATRNLYAAEIGVTDSAVSVETVY